MNCIYCNKPCSGTYDGIPCCDKCYLDLVPLNSPEVPKKKRTIKAHIEHDPMKPEGKGLWLMIDRPDMEGIAIGAITEDELIPIMEAIREYIGEDINKMVMNQSQSPSSAHAPDREIKL